MYSERQQPIETDRHALFNKVKRCAEPENKDTPYRAGDRFGLFEHSTEYQDRNGEKLENAEPDCRGRVENVGDCGYEERYGQEPQAPAHIAAGQRTARPRQDDEKPSEKILGYRPGNGCQVRRKAKKPLDADICAQVVKKVVADHQDNGQAAQEIDFPDASRTFRLTHRARILRSSPKRQAIVKLSCLDGPET